MFSSTQSERTLIHPYIQAVEFCKPKMSSKISKKSAHFYDATHQTHKHTNTHVYIHTGTYTHRQQHVRLVDLTHMCLHECVSMRVRFSSSTNHRISANISKSCRSPLTAYQVFYFFFIFLWKSQNEFFNNRIIRVDLSVSK